MTSICEYANVTGKGVPIPMAGSFSYAVTDLGIGELTGLIRRQAMPRGAGTVPRVRYGWLRRNGYYISSCHVEAAARILVARRCKQAGMHWRIHNAACVCAIIARLRSAA